MRIAYFDPYSGASGDMTLGSLLDAGGSISELRAQIESLELGAVTIDVERVSQHGIGGIRVTIAAPDDQPHRRWSDIRATIAKSGLSETVRTRALSIFERLAVAEASVHDVDVEEVHFHEVGAIDAIVDICGAAILLESMRIEAVFSGPVSTGRGMVRAAHGLLPIPAPATAAVLANAGVPIAPPQPGAESWNAELLTPTGAAILATVARFEQPPMRSSTIGYGFGRRELPWPNALRVVIGETDDEIRSEPAHEVVLETNLDDMSPQHVELLTERLFAARALDVWTTPIVMKKGRPALMVSVLAGMADRSALETVLIENSTTLGVRTYPVARVKAARRIETVATRWGDVRVKLRGWNGRVIDVAPEYDDCLRFAREAEMPLREIWNEAHRLAEAYVGRRLSPEGTLLLLDDRGAQRPHSSTTRP